MGIRWGNYEVFDPGVTGPLQDLPRKDATFAFDKLMHEKEERITQLRRLLRENRKRLATDDAGIRRLNEWFVASVEPDPKDPRRLLGRWYSVVNDIGLFLGDIIIERSGQTLSWRMFTAGKDNVAYQRHVIMGLRVPNPKYNVDVDMDVAGVGHDALVADAEEAEELRGRFARVVRAAVARA